MALRRKIGSVCSALLLAASITALTVGAARPQDLDDLGRQLVENPGDVELNLRYARAAEASGQRRLALTAYERILINDPSNEEARAGYERIRRAIEPPFSITRIEAGVRWDSNPLNDGATDQEAETFFVNGTLVDERSIASHRWRTAVQGEFEQTPDIEQLDNLYLGAQTGPLVRVGPHTAALPAVGVAGSTLDGDHYFSEANAGLTFEGRGDSFSYWWRLRGGWRDYSDKSTADNGPYAELIGGLTAPQFLSERGTLVVVPWVRWSDIEGSAFSFVQENVPGQYTEYGIEAEYRHRLSDHLVAAAGARVRERDYENTTLPFSTETRRDTYIAPTASLTLTNALPCSCDVRARYQHRDNDSNDSTVEYDAEQIQLSLIARF